MKISHEWHTHEEVFTQGGDALTPGDANAQSTVAPFTIYVTDRDGNQLANQSPCTHEAHAITYDVHINDLVAPTKADMGFYSELSKIEHALAETYKRNVAKGEAFAEARFRPHFVRLFHLAQLVLEGDVTVVDGEHRVGKRLPPDVAKDEITALATDVIDDEAPAIKNAHLRELADAAVKLAIPFLIVHMLLLSVGQASGTWLGRALRSLKIDSVMAANFMLLWVGSFVGVCLSYAIRTHSFSLTDLSRTDADYLAPWARLLLTGTFAMVLAMLAVVQLGDVVVGSRRLSEIGGQAMFAFVSGAVIGISEQKLTNTVGKRVDSLFGGANK